MNTTYKDLFCVILIACISTALYSQPCPYNFMANGDPITPGTVLAENQIGSSGKVHAPDTVNFSAGKGILLNPMFEVYEGGIFEAYIEGCVSTCPDVNPCIDEICTRSYPPTDFDSEGNEYYKHELIIKFPPNVELKFPKVNGQNSPSVCDPVIYDNTLQVNTIGNQYCFSLDTLLSGVLGYPIGIGKIDTCLCGENIIKYTNENMILQETTPRQASCRAGASEGGGRFSLNYIYQKPFKLHTNFTGPLIPDFNAYAIPMGIPSPSHTPLIAILDTGVEPRFLKNIPGDPFNGKYLYNLASTICDINGSFGWNFVDDNNNIKDDRGHGTLVAATMIEAFYKMVPVGIPTNIYPRILTVKILDTCGRGNTYDAACGIKYAELQGADIMNLSWGIPFNDQILQQVILEATSTGSYMSCSAGNNGLDLTTEEHFPSGYSNPFMFIDEEGDSTLVSGNSHVYEVAGICKSLQDPCQPNAVNLPLWDNSNYFSTSFAEPALAAQYLINRHLPPGSKINCDLNGTSFSAAIFTADIIRQTAYGSITKALMKNQSYKIHIDNEFYSYYLEKCN